MLLRYATKIRFDHFRALEFYCDKIIFKMYKLPVVLFFERINGFNHPFYLLYNICSKIKCSKSKSLFQMENRKENMHW